MGISEGLVNKRMMSKIMITEFRSDSITSVASCWKCAVVNPHHDAATNVRLLPWASLHPFFPGEEGPRLHFCLGFGQRWTQQRPLLLRRLHQLHLHHLHLQHGGERTQAVVPRGVLVHAHHHLQQWGELWPQDSKRARNTCPKENNSASPSSSSPNDVIVSRHCLAVLHHLHLFHLA